VTVVTVDAVCPCGNVFQRARNVPSQTLCPDCRKKATKDYLAGYRSIHAVQKEPAPETKPWVLVYDPTGEFGRLELYPEEAELSAYYLATGSIIWTGRRCKRVCENGALEAKPLRPIETVAVGKRVLLTDGKEWAVAVKTNNGWAWKLGKPIKPTGAIELEAQ